MGHSFRDLIVWQKAKALAVSVYGATEAFPDHELYGLTAQVRRAAVSVVCNIAEGQGRMTRGEFKQFLGHARGSLFEVETQLEIARDLGYLSADQFAALDARLSEVRKLLHGLCNSRSAKAQAAGQN